VRATCWLSICGVALLTACAGTPPQPAPGTAARAAPDDPIATAIASHRDLARQYAQAGDPASAAREWQIVLLLAPGDGAARAQHEAARAAILEGVRDNLQAGMAAVRSGDADRATRAMLTVLALDPENAEAAKSLRDIERQRLTRIQYSQSLRAARESQAGAAAANRTAAAAAPDPGDTYDLEQRVEMFRAGDISGGLREFRSFVDANPRNDAARLRIATIVYERAGELEQKGAREDALLLYEQAASLRGKPAPEWAARAQSLRKTLAVDYYERGVQTYRTDVAGAVRLWETSVKYDPRNRPAQARLQEARAALERQKRAERDRKPQ
jgi:tetratricopeptide (TPR) repeat protein